ncbi:MAG: hypothetical protein H6733_12065 [Alphaproteobacteria bacterium]|nr:hypothetical protein [Alphaproteobacteria bacterium]
MRWWTFAIVMAGCDAGEAPATSAPAATVDHRVAESDLATVHLTEDAERRLDVQVATVVAGSLPAVRVARGVVVALAGGLALGAPGSDGARQALAEAVVAAEASREMAQAEEEAARAELDRARALVALDASSARRLDEARARHARARADAAASRDRLALLVSLGTGSSPANRVRVPLLAGEVDDLDAEAPVEVRRLGARPERPPARGAVVEGPQSADPSTGMVDVFVAVPAADVRIGEVVEVALRRRATDAGLAVPAGAVVYDPWGGAWVYVRLAPQTYRRVRVVPRGVVDGTAVLDVGPPEGTPVVEVAAAELLGIEFGAGK